MKNKIYRLFLNGLYVSLPEAQQIIAEKMRGYDFIRWDEIKVTRNEYCLYQLMGTTCRLYGYLTITGAISKYAELQIIPYNDLPRWNDCGYTRWSEDCNTIVISRTNEPFYTGICIRKRDLRRYLKTEDKKPDIKEERIMKIEQSLVTKLKLYFQKNENPTNNPCS